MNKIKLKTSQTQFETLHEKIDGYKVMRKVNRTAMKNLLADYKVLRAKISNVILNRVETRLQKLNYPLGVDKDLMKRINTGGTKLVELDKKHVMSLLIDHSVLIGHLQEAGVEFS